MAFDISRNTFNAWNDYLGVLMQQGALLGRREVAGGAMDESYTQPRFHRSQAAAHRGRGAVPATRRFGQTP